MDDKNMNDVESSEIINETEITDKESDSSELETTIDNVKPDIKTKLITIIKEYGFPILWGVLIFLFISIFVRTSVVIGNSMYPTYYDGDRFFIVRDTWVQNYERGDVVCVNQDGRILIKRIVGVAGDTVVLKDGKVFRKNETVSLNFKSLENLF